MNPTPPPPQPRSAAHLFWAFTGLTMAALLATQAEVLAVQGALRGMSAVAAGLIGSAAVKLLPTLKQNVLSAPVSYALAAFSFIAIVGLRLPLVWLLLGLGGLYSVATWWRLAGAAPRAQAGGGRFG